MPKAGYIGVDGTARKIKKGYFGVDGAARKIRKGYIGVGGVARPCWSGDPISYYGVITPGSCLYNSHIACQVGGYALFGGGAWKATSSGKRYAYGTVAAYGPDLTYTQISNLSTARIVARSAYVANYAIFADGQYYSSGDYEYTGAISVYDGALAKVSASLTGSGGIDNGAAVSAFQGRAIFGGGVGDTAKSTVYTISASLTKASLTGLTTAVGDNGAAAAGESYAIFGGGNTTSSESANTTAYSASFTKTTCPPFGQIMTHYHAFSCGDKAIFAGEQATDVYSTSLTRSAGPVLQRWSGGTRNQNYLKTPDGKYIVLAGTGYTELLDDTLTVTQIAAAMPAEPTNLSRAEAFAGNYLVRAYAGPSSVTREWETHAFKYEG